jgi:hypothetical protein
MRAQGLLGQQVAPRPGIAAWKAGSPVRSAHVINSASVLRSEHASLDALVKVLPLSWRAHTAWIDDWDERNPARGQCGSTALVVQDLHGGTLMTGVVGDGSHPPLVHYWNVLAAGVTDLTWQQFPASARVLHRKAAVRSELLCRSWFIDRYQALRDQVQLLLDEEPPSSDTRRCELAVLRIASTASLDISA